MVFDFLRPIASGKLDRATGARLASIAKKRIRNEQNEKEARREECKATEVDSGILHAERIDT